MTEQPKLSASQIQTFVDCPRKWGFKYLQGIRMPSTPAAELGTKTHEVLAEYLSTGRPPSLKTAVGSIALAGIPYLPSPKTAKVEEYFEFKTERSTYRGFIDFSYQENGLEVVGDHKTTAGFRFSKSPSDLLSDIQAHIYARHTMLKKKCDSVKLKWVYYKTKGRSQAKSVEIILNKKASDSYFEKLERISDDIQDHYKDKPKPKDILAKTASCFRYGPCPFIGKCQQLNNQTIKKEKVA